MTTLVLDDLNLNNAKSDDEIAPGFTFRFEPTLTISEINRALYNAGLVVSHVKTGSYVIRRRPGA